MLDITYTSVLDLEGSDCENRVFSEKVGAFRADLTEKVGAYRAKNLKKGGL